MFRTYSIPSRYADLSAYLDGRPCRTLAHNTVAWRTGDGSVAVTFHATTIATVHPDDSVTVQTGGWHTATTKQRINAILGDRARVSQDRFAWFLTRWTEPVGWAACETVPFTDGMTIPLRPR